RRIVLRQAQRRRAEPRREAGRDRVTGDLDVLAGRERVEQRRYLHALAPVHHLACGLETQELREMNASALHRLPHQQRRPLVSLREPVRGDETSRPQRPDRVGPGRYLAERRPSRRDVVEPALPVGIPEVAVAVAATREVDLKHGPAGGRERRGGERDHPSRFVHFLGERMHEQHPADGGIGRGQRQQREAASARGFDVENAAADQDVLAARLPSTNATSVPTVSNVEPSSSSSSTTKPNRSSSPLITPTTAIESSSGTAPSSGVSRSKDAARPRRLSTSSRTDNTCSLVSKIETPLLRRRDQYALFSARPVAVF